MHSRSRSTGNGTATVPIQQHHTPPTKYIGIESSRHHIGQHGAVQHQRPIYPPDQGLSSISDHDDLKNRSFRQHQMMKLQSPLHHQLSPNRNQYQQQQQNYNGMINPQQHQHHPMIPTSQQIRSNRMMNLSQNIPPPWYKISMPRRASPTNRQPQPLSQSQHQQSLNHMSRNPSLPQQFDPNVLSLRSSNQSPRVPIAPQQQIHSHGGNLNGGNNNAQSAVPWATYTPSQKSPLRNPTLLSQNHSSARPTTTAPPNRYNNPSHSQLHPGVIPPPFGQQPSYVVSDGGNNSGTHHRPATFQHSPHSIPTNNTIARQHRPKSPSVPNQMQMHQYRPDQQHGGVVQLPTNRLPSNVVDGNSPPYYQQHRQSRPLPAQHQQQGLTNNKNPRTSSLSSSRRPQSTTSTKNVVMYFNTNGSAKHVDHTVGSIDDTKPKPPPRPINDSAGSRVRLFFGATCHEFVLLTHEDDGSKSWQSKVWRNVPIGLDMKLHTLDTVQYCSFSGNDWFILTQCDQTGKYKSYWSVESAVLHSALATYAQTNAFLRLVFGENGQYVILHGTNGYQLGSNIPTQLQMALDRAYTSGSSIVGVHGLNTQGRFIVHLLKKESDVNNDSFVPVDVQQPMASFCAKGLSLQLDQFLKAANKLEKLNFVLSTKDTSWIFLRDDAFDQTDDIHYDLVTELDGFYSRHKNRQMKRAEEIEKFYQNERLRHSSKKPYVDENQTATEVESASKAPEKEVANVKIVDQNTYSKNDIDKLDIKSNAEAEAPWLPDNIHRSGHNKTVVPAEKKSGTKKLNPSAIRAQKLLDKEDQISELIRKGIAVGDRVTVLGISAELGDSIVKSIGTIDGCVIVLLPNDTSPKKKVPGDKTAATSEIRRLIKYVKNEELTSIIWGFQGFPVDKYEAAMQLFHVHCKASACDCKTNFLGSTERFQKPSSWKTGDQVNVVGYTNGTVISSNSKYSSKASMVHVEYDDGTSYHVKSDQVRPIKRFIDPGSCCFASLKEHEERALRLRPLLDETSLTPFNEYKCSERIDKRRLQRLVANLQSDSEQRKECMKSLILSLDENPNDELAGQCYNQLEHCYDLEEALYMFYDHVKSLPMGDNGYVTYEVEYSHKNLSCRGRLFSIGRSVRVLEGKFPRTATMQGLHAEFHSPLTGAFAHEIHIPNSDVRILNSLAQQLALDDMIPTLKDYCYNPDTWLEIIHEEHPNVDISDVKRFVSVIVCGGTYETWLGFVGENDVVPKLKRFGFRLVSEIQALYDQLVDHPRFQWTFLERKKLDSMGYNELTVKTMLCLRILHASENEVIGMIHRTFHDHRWIVRTKVFDSIIVEHVPNGTDKHHTLETMMRVAERYCDTMKWDIRLVENDLHGCEDRPLPSFREARSSMREYMRSMKHDDDDDNLITTVTPSVGKTSSHSHNDTDDEFDGSNTNSHCMVEALGDSYESLDSESTFHDDSESDMVHSIALPHKYRVSDGNNGS